MIQTRLFSFLESVARAIVGFVFTILIQFGMYWWMDIEVKINQNIALAIVFLLFSILRAYLVRRAFERLRVVKYFFLKKKKQQ